MTPETNVLCKIEATFAIYWKNLIIDHQNLKEKCVFDPKGRKHMEWGIDLGTTQ